MMEEIKVLWKVGSGEEPEFAGWRPQVIEIALSDKENVLMKSVVRYRK